MSSTVVLGITGMTCGSCSASITEQVSRMDGVNDVTVSLITEEGRISFDEARVSVSDVIETIEDCGFEAKIKSLQRIELKTTLAIQGMTCGACSASITEALEKTPGVKTVNVSLITEKGLVTHSADASPESLKEAIEDCGFDAQVEKTVASPESSSEKYMAHSSIFSIKGMTCGSCSASITEALSSNEHISDVNVSLVTEEGAVEHDGNITPEQVRDIIEDCGFQASIITSKPLWSGLEGVGDDEELSLQIYGLSEISDITSFQYNVEAFLNSFNGIKSFQIALKSLPSNSDAPLVTDANSSSVRALRSDENDADVFEEGNFVDELTINYSYEEIGVRNLVSGLNAIDEHVRFVVLNSVDLSSAAQLKLLTRTKDIQYWKSNLLKSLILGLPVVILSHTQDTKLWHNLILFPGLYLATLIQFVLTTHIQFKLGAVFMKKFHQFIKNRGMGASMDVLVCISTMVSYIFSFVSMVLSIWSGQTNKPPNLSFETSAMLITFVSLGKWLENKAKGATSTALSRLISLTPSTCTIITDPDKFLENMESAPADSNQSYTTQNISIDLIQPNDITVVLAGSKIPADGVLILGETEVDESLITGESNPVYKHKGDQVIGGTINGPNVVHVRVTSSGRRSKLSQIINLVKDSQMKKAPLQRFADYIAARFVAGVLLLSSATFIFWVIVSYNFESLPKIFMKDENGKLFVCVKLAISVVVVACPCALGLAAPTAIMVGTGVGATNGILIKGGDIFERVRNLRVIIFDKTGTLTTGKMEVKNVKQILPSGMSSKEWWTLVGTVESNSEHSIGSSIARKAKVECGLLFDNDKFSNAVKDIHVLTGMGISAQVHLVGDPKESYEVHIGNKRMIEESHAELIDRVKQEYAQGLQESVTTIAHVVVDGQYCGYLELRDTLKDGAKEVIDYLMYTKNYQVGIVTGDNTAAAESVGRELGIPVGNIFSEVSPIHKDKVIADLKAKSGKSNVGIAFVGDGINDAPALARADVGIAISSGTDIAIESADIVVMARSSQSDLMGIPATIDLSHLTFNRIKLNFLWAAVYNTIMLPFAMGCFLPFNIMLPPVFAGLSMALSSVSVVLSSLMIRLWIPPKVVGAKPSKRIDFEATAFNLKDSSIPPSFSSGQKKSPFSRFIQRIKSYVSDPADATDYELLPQ